MLPAINYSVGVSMPDAPAPFEEYRTGFDPKVDSFAFPNEFYLWPSKRRGMYGLCGGMCFAALDYWKEDGLPYLWREQTDPPTSWGAPVFDYLWERQIDSMNGLRVPFKTLQWMARPYEETAWETRRRELLKVEARIRSGYPVVLCVLRTRNLLRPTHNHQVVVTGFFSDGNVTTLLCYDPNWPRQEVLICVHWRKPVMLQDTGERVVGFFAIDYQWKEPV